MEVFINWQPSLANEKVSIRPLVADDFETLYELASDPLVWEQHPNKNRYQREVFGNFFSGAMESGGAFMVYDAATNVPIGSSRFYDYNAQDNRVLIGYTFFGRAYWGGQYNPALKKLMLDYAFQFVDTVVFHIGAGNIRSQKAIEKLGAKKTGELSVAYHGEPNRDNFVYAIEKQDWLSR